MELLLVSKDRSKEGELDIECCRVWINSNLLKFLYFFFFRKRKKIN